jgi:hypothetical protein
MMGGACASVGPLEQSARINRQRGSSRTWLLPALLIGLASCGPRGAIPDPQNELPFGFVDQPQDGSTVGTTVAVHGWALDDGHIASVRIFVDNRFRTTASLGLPRPDVSRAYPQHAKGGDGHGWAVTLDLSDRDGTRTLVVQALDNCGATRDIGAIQVLVGDR